MSNNPVRDLARYFITEFIGRRMLPADYYGRHMKAASKLLKKMGYDYDAVVAALMCLKERDYAQFGYSFDDLPKNMQGMEMLWYWGEPPLIERFLAPDPMPAVYSYDFDKWVRRWGKTAIRRGEWDGLYTKCDPETVPWLEGVVGSHRYEESIATWQTLQKTSPPKNLLSDGSPKTPPP